MNFRTDMADERADLFSKSTQNTNNIDGVNIVKKDINNNIKSTFVKITNKNGEEALGKKIGSYVTFDIKNIKVIDEDEIVEFSGYISDELKNIINDKIKFDEPVLIVGLGNENVTPDSLGPKVVSNIEITRHLLKYAPQYVIKDARSVCAIAPGVLGTTGIETFEIIKGIVQNINPKLIIVIDSLASIYLDRICSTIQISDTGIVPGSGVENARKELSYETLGVPVIAMGVPMVFDLASITNDSYNMMVTPKEVDSLIDNMKNIISRSINYAL